MHPSRALSERFDLKLSRSWKRWFDLECHEIALPGCFRFPVSVEVLCQERPAPIWAGFMQPDTLPIIGNGYGDWLCVRVTQTNELGELIHWYHGGGDWIPVGNSIAEAILHDAVDRFRPLQKQMLRGAAESLPQQSTSDTNETIDSDNRLVDWSHLHLSKAHPGVPIASILEQASGGHYLEALEMLVEHEVSPAASVCDLIEYLIRDALPDEHRSLAELPEPLWKRIEQLCARIHRLRADLGWSHALVGWSRQVRSKQERAMKSYFKGRFASAYSDQSVRLRLHRFDQRFGKFSIAQLATYESMLPESMSTDDYLKTVMESSSDNIHANVQRFWQRSAAESFAKKKFASAYDAVFRAGWDVGVAKLSDYRALISQLAQAAQQAHWQSRMLVAQTHLRCL